MMAASGPGEAMTPATAQDRSLENPRMKRYLKTVIAVTAVAAVIVLARFLPVQDLLEATSSAVESLGAWAPLVFGAVYVAATLLFVPGSALTLAAGPLFGLVGGTVVVSLASTIGAALAFLIARHVARSAVQRKLGGHPRFLAVDRALEEGGWKIVALLRLSPAVPFNALNYLLGLTAIRFWPATLTSWVAMLPGTLLYVYLGYVGTTTLSAAGGASSGRTAGEWTSLIAGLAATLLVTVYVTRAARRALANIEAHDKGTANEKRT